MCPDGGIESREVSTPDDARDAVGRDFAESCTPGASPIRPVSKVSDDYSDQAATINTIYAITTPYRPPSLQPRQIFMVCLGNSVTDKRCDKAVLSQANKADKTAKAMTNHGCHDGLSEDALQRLSLYLICIDLGSDPCI